MIMVIRLVVNTIQSLLSDSDTAVFHIFLNIETYEIWRKVILTFVEYNLFLLLALETDDTWALFSITIEYFCG